MNNLNQAAGGVDESHQSIRLLKDLQVSVLQLQGVTDPKRFAQLQENYDVRLTQLS